MREHSVQTLISAADGGTFDLPHPAAHCRLPRPSRLITSNPRQLVEIARAHGSSVSPTLAVEPPQWYRRVIIRSSVAKSLRISSAEVLLLRPARPSSGNAPVYGVYSQRRGIRFYSMARGSFQYKR